MIEYPRQFPPWTFPVFKKFAIMNKWCCNQRKCATIDLIVVVLLSTTRSHRHSALHPIFGLLCLAILSHYTPSVGGKRPKKKLWERWKSWWPSPDPHWMIRLRGEARVSCVTPSQACIICGILASWMPGTFFLPGTFWQFVAIYVLFRHFFWKKIPIYVFILAKCRDLCAF